MFRKVNLVTQPNMMDTWKCQECGHRLVSPMGPPRICPDCKVHCHLDSDESAALHYDEFKLESETVEGCWSIRDHIGKVKCSKCGVVLIEVPKSGHPNSSYWKLQRHVREVLLCCSNGCLENK